MADRSVLVTGSTGGLGAAVTAAFVEAGWRVVAAQRQQPTPTPRPDANAPVRLVADLTDARDAARAAEVAAGDPAAPLRAVVNLVGGYASTGLVHETPIEDFERMLTLNLRPTHLVTRAALPHLVAAGGGAVVCVAARAALAPFPGVAGYVTAKAAVLGFAAAVAVEYRNAGVRCNTVLPSVIDTPTNRDAMPDADQSRWVDPAEIASVIRFLASDESAPTSGAAVPVYGRA
ncbi:NAD(P)-dependent dehydrogenase, short-chain alcohol dehydrogenase family [Micromonospora phaseoli]|uniref:NAD(P)-dependent dehydrogenase, short-chain alcohol dehydrogenase family n=1 Tax=Micromonospora phaseoli TaxID=1144548 RepID=A0A1H6WK54_9ACTN|nr:SDR family NAD(P)-dependent oxidoreductase [Micromonospora phaseoli]PZW01695.1 NAD(P)-dependent dehydrogenase (short-subunit alcohol dehydrogenase family) [Micromonospora phaseoli]SEJ13160.1 NAD(P)-dependent dehydrogenase, short-chain alcohol dehydrogenase family [Micromonospora phaseoli]